MSVPCFTTASEPRSSLLSNLRFLWDKAAVFLPLLIGPLLPHLPLIRKDLSGSVVLITGSNAGIGYGLARHFASLNARVFLACRNPQKAGDARLRILASYPDADVQTRTLDTSSFASVRRFADEWLSSDVAIDILIHNAGIASLPVRRDGSKQELSTDGLPLMYQTNFLSSFLLTKLVEPCLASSARVLFTSSMSAYNGDLSTSSFSLSHSNGAVEPGFHSLSNKPAAKALDSDMYYQTKLMQIVFSRILQQRFNQRSRHQSASSSGSADKSQVISEVTGSRKSGRLAFAWEPGLVATGLQSQVSQFSLREDPAFKMISWCLKLTAITLEQGVATGVYVAISEDDAVVAEGGPGEFWTRNITRLSPASFYRQDLLDRCWDRWLADIGESWT